MYPFSDDHDHHRGFHSSVSQLIRHDHLLLLTTYRRDHQEVMILKQNPPDIFELHVLRVFIQDEKVTAIFRPIFVLQLPRSIVFRHGEPIRTKIFPPSRNLTVT